MHPNYYISYRALIGGGMFVTTIVVGTVILVSSGIAKRNVGTVYTSDSMQFYYILCY